MTNTDAATIPLLLEELWEVDFETWKDIRFLLLNSMMFSEPREIPLEQHIYHDIIQGCIQRAIAGRIETGAFAGYMLLYDLMGCEATITMGKEHDYDDIEERADTPAAAILAAYIEAVRARH